MRCCAIWPESTINAINEEADSARNVFSHKSCMSCEVSGGSASAPAIGLHRTNCWCPRPGMRYRRANRAESIASVRWPRDTFLEMCKRPLTCYSDSHVITHYQHSYLSTSGLNLPEP